MERNWQLANVLFHGSLVQMPAVIALGAGELISLVVHKAEKQVELAELVFELRLEVSDLLAARAVLWLWWANGNRALSLADHEHHAITCISRLTPELSRAAKRRRLE